MMQLRKYNMPFNVGVSTPPLRIPSPPLQTLPFPPLFTDLQASGNPLMTIVEMDFDRHMSRIRSHRRMERMS